MVISVHRVNANKSLCLCRLAERNKLIGHTVACQSPHWGRTKLRSPCRSLLLLWCFGRSSLSPRSTPLLGCQSARPFCPDIIVTYRCYQTYCFEPGDGVSVSAGSAPRSPDATQSPAHSLVPLTVPTNLQSSGAFGFACEGSLLGAPVCANATTEKQVVMRATSSGLMVVSLSPPPRSGAVGFAHDCADQG